MKFPYHRCLNLIVPSLAVLLSSTACQAHPSTSLKGKMAHKSNGGQILEEIYLKIDSEDFEAQWRLVLGKKNHKLYSYNANENASGCIEVIRDSFCFLVDKLPPLLVHKLMTFAEDPNAHCALLIRGLPIDRDVPPTPNPRTIGGRGDRQTLCPLAETVLLGMSRLMGTPHCPPAPFSTGLVRDIVPVSADELEELPMHRDFPRQSTGNGWEPQLFCLLCVRGDPNGCATVVTDCKTLIQALSKQDVELLSEYSIQAQIRNPNADEEEWMDFGKEFKAIEADHDLVTLFDFPGSRHTSPKGGAQVEEAYQRLARLARKLGQTVVLEPGDMLILNNAKCVHGRTRYKPLMDGTDRWLVKSYVSLGVWNRPGTQHVGLANYPQMELSADKQFREGRSSHK